MGAAESEPGITVPYEKNPNENESDIYINSIRIRENGGPAMIHYTYRPDVRTLTEMLDSSVVIYGDRDCLGEREIKEDGSFGNYKWMNYREFKEKCINFAKGLQALGLKKGDKVGIYSVNCNLWQIAQFGSLYAGCVPVPVYDSLGPGAASYITSHAECKVVLAHKKNVAKAIKILDDYPELLKIISMDENTEENHEKLMKVSELFKLAEGKELENPHLTKDDIAMIMYTSGSTGKPKGCVLTHEGVIAGGNGLGGMGTSVTHLDTYFSFLPLAHIYELCSQTTLICQGARIGFYTGDMRNMMSDVQALHPTIMCGVPRVFNRLYDGMMSKINKLPSIAKKLILFAIKHKNDCLLSGKRPSEVLDTLLLSNFSNALGGRLRLIVNGGAPILPHVYEFCRAAVTPNIIQGYGLTEICAAGCVQQCGDPNPNTVGPVAITIDMKLRKVPGMDYDPRSEEPTGEIMYKGPSLFREYYKNPELTKEALVDGWFATGDIGKIRKDGTVQIIDRVKQLVKLSQGEYLSITSLTDTYGTAKGVQSIYVYADSMHDKPIAVVVPDPKLIEEMKTNQAKVKETLMNNLNEVFVHEKLRGFEKLADILIDNDPFTIENGMLTPSQKPQINAIKNKYEVKLNELYDGITNGNTVKSAM